MLEEEDDDRRSSTEIIADFGESQLSSYDYDEEFEMLVKAYMRDVNYTTVNQAALNIVCSMVNSGLIALPYCAQEVGIPIYLVGLIATALIAGYTSVMVISMANEQRVRTLEDLADNAFGSAGFIAVSILQLLFSFSLMCITLDIWADIMSDVFSETSVDVYLISERRGQVILGACFILPLCTLKKSLASLRWTSYVTVVAIIGALSAVIMTYLTDKSTMVDSNTTFVKEITQPKSNWWAFVFIGVYVFSCNQKILTIYTSLRRRTAERWSTAVWRALGCVVVVYGIFGVFGYVSKERKEVNLTSFDFFVDNSDENKDVFDPARAIVAFSLLLTMPLDCLVASTTWRRLWSKYSKQRAACLQTYCSSSSQRDSNGSSSKLFGYHRGSGGSTAATSTATLAQLGGAVVVDAATGGRAIGEVENILQRDSGGAAAAISRGQGRDSRGQGQGKGSKGQGKVNKKQRRRFYRHSHGHLLSSSTGAGTLGGGTGGGGGMAMMRKSAPLPIDSSSSSSYSASTSNWSIYRSLLSLVPAGATAAQTHHTQPGQPIAQQQPPVAAIRRGSSQQSSKMKTASTGPGGGAGGGIGGGGGTGNRSMNSARYYRKLQPGGGQGDGEEEGEEEEDEGDYDEDEDEEEGDEDEEQGRGEGGRRTEGVSYRGYNGQEEEKLLGPADLLAQEVERYSLEHDEDEGGGEGGKLPYKVTLLDKSTSISARRQFSQEETEEILQQGEHLTVFPTRQQVIPTVGLWLCSLAICLVVDKWLYLAASVGTISTILLMLIFPSLLYFRLGLLTDYQAIPLVGRLLPNQLYMAVILALGILVAAFDITVVIYFNITHERIIDQQ